MLMDMSDEIKPWRGKLRKARVQHECSGYSEQDEYGYTYYSSGDHFIEPGEIYVDARYVWPAGIDSEGEAYPMGSVPMRCCIDCASSRGMLSYKDANALTYGG